MKPASTIGAIYLGVYMILPACLCQLLAAFGISLHDSALPDHQFAFSERAVSIACHCDDHLAKSAEPELNTAEAPTYVASLHVLPLDSAAGRRANSAQRSGLPRGPPSGLAGASRRAISGVFLI